MLEKDNGKSSVLDNKENWKSLLEESFRLHKWEFSYGEVDRSAGVIDFFFGPVDSDITKGYPYFAIKMSLATGEVKSVKLRVSYNAAKFYNGHGKFISPELGQFHEADTVLRTDICRDLYQTFLNLYTMLDSGEDGGLSAVTLPQLSDGRF